MTTPTRWYTIQQMKENRWKDVVNVPYIGPNFGDAKRKAIENAKYHGITHNVKTRVLRCVLVYRNKPFDEDEETTDISSPHGD